ncbi:MAG: hypothetical protein JWO38_2615 [Gemmataceae bacterium]|nr:hypothetical protein [Gemmataceae bacterium]
MPMMLLWKIHYLDRSDRQFKDRCLSLTTKTLDPLTRAKIELIAKSDSSRTNREILKYRHLFKEDDLESDLNAPIDCDEFRFVGLDPEVYYEDETGKEITGDEVAQILSGSPTARLIPCGARQHDIDLMFAERKPLPVAEVALTPDDVRLLGYFVRDLRELSDSAFMKDRPGSINFSGDSPLLSPNSKPTLKTPATDEEIRSFVTIFRRLYMPNEPANFQKAGEVFVRAMGNHHQGKWADAVAAEYKNHLASVPDHRPFIQPGTCTFTTKRLIDVFLYTSYAHQPDEQRQRQYNDCLREVHGKADVLTWMFLTKIWTCTLEIGNVGRIIAGWFKAYCDHHGVTPDVLNSLHRDLRGLGAEEKEEDRRKRLFQEQVEKLAVDLWEQAGQPQGGHMQFLARAREQLT